MTEINKDIEKLNDKELEEKVIELNRDQLSSIKKASYLNAMYSINTTRNHFWDEERFKRENYRQEAEKIDNYIDDIQRLILEVDRDKILDIREKLFRKRNILEGYLVEISYLGEMVDEEGIKLLSDTREFAHFHRESVDEIVDIIHKGLDNAQANHNKYMFIISEIIKVLPMRLVKQNYYDILNTTIKRNLINRNQTYVETQIDNYKKNFDSSTRDGYGMEFDYYFMEIHKIKRENLEDKTIEELSVYVEKIVELTEELTMLKELIQALGIVLNMLIVVDLLKDIEVDMKRSIDEWNKAYLSEDEEKIFNFNKSVEVELASIEREIQEDVSYYQNLTVEVASRKDFDQKLLDEELIKTREVLAYYNDIGFSSMEFLESFDMEVSEESYIENCIASLFDYMERSMREMPNKERKIRMRNLMAMVELPFNNINEFTNYVRYSLDSRIVDVRIINFKINQIIYFLNEVKDK